MSSKDFFLKDTLLWRSFINISLHFAGSLLKYPELVTEILSDLAILANKDQCRSM